MGDRDDRSSTIAWVVMGIVIGLILLGAIATVFVLSGSGA